jgi:hypothetical protein
VLVRSTLKDTSSAISVGHSRVKTLNKNPNLNKLNLRPPHNYLPWRYPFSHRLSHSTFFTRTLENRVAVLARKVARERSSKRSRGQRGERK